MHADRIDHYRTGRRLPTPPSFGRHSQIPTHGLHQRFVGPLRNIPSGRYFSLEAGVAAASLPVRGIAPARQSKEHLDRVHGTVRAVANLLAAE